MKSITTFSEKAKEVSLGLLVRYWASGLALFFLFNCTILGIKVEFDRVITALANDRAVVIAQQMYDQRNIEDVKLRARLYSEEVLSKPIVFPRPGEPLLGERMPALNKEARKLKNPTQGEYNLIVEATAYWVMDPVEASGDGIAYDGTPAVPYHTIAVDPKVIPLQSEVFVPGVGWCRANDTGNAIKGRIIDVAMPTRDDAWNWGRKLVYVKVRPPKK